MLRIPSISSKSLGMVGMIHGFEITTLVGNLVSWSLQTSRIRNTSRDRNLKKSELLAQTVGGTAVLKASTCQVPRGINVLHFALLLSG
jgi:hypothetical protein